MEWTSGIKMMGRSGVTKHGCKQLRCGMKPGMTGMRVGQLTGLTDNGQRIGPRLVKNSSKNIQAVVRDPRTVKFSHWFWALIGRILWEVSTGLFLQSEIDELGSSNSHSSWRDSVVWSLHVVWRVLMNNCFAIVTTVNSKSGRMAESMTVHCRDSPRWHISLRVCHRYVKSLPAEFFDDPELVLLETDACSVVFYQPRNLGTKLICQPKGSKTSVLPRRNSMVQYCGTDHAFEGQLVVATSAPKLLAGEEEQAAADASLSRAPPSATADTLTSDELLSPIFVPMFLPGYTAPRPTLSVGMGIKRRQSRTSTDSRNCLLFTSIRNSRNIKIISKTIC